MNRRKSIGIALLALAVAGGAGLAWQGRRDAAPQSWRTVALTRGPLVATVNATGTLAATVQVQVSSQVSGQIREVRADFNDEVRQGQVLARLDSETFEYRLAQAQADWEAASAQVAVQEASLAARVSDARRVSVNLDEARRDEARKTELVGRGYLALAERDRARAQVEALEQELASAQAQITLARAQVRTAKAAVQQRTAQRASAQVDLARTVIRAPVDGIVIKRSIEPGQTVAVSLQAPELFLIARNLRDMQVEVAIDEAEVSRVRPGMPCTFTVDAFATQVFDGVVKQVRKAARNDQNVITYIAVVAVRNVGQNLLPGMTANVRIVTDTRPDALRIPQAALRFKPAARTESVAAEIRAMPDAPRAAGQGRVYILGAEGAPVPVDVTLGISDGSTTELLEVTQGRALVAGDAVLVGRAVADSPARSQATRPGLRF